jgi:hypothetical protein
MGPEEQLSWKDEALDFLLQAIAGDPSLRQMLVFKGARILYMGLGVPGRKSLDLDATLQLDESDAPSERVAGDIEHSLERALRIAVRRDDPVRYQFQSVRVMPNPQRRHPHGWQGYTVTINLDDFRRPGTIGVPKLEIDIAAPETLRPGAVAELPVRNGSVLAYSLARQTAEKLRAFLQSSPTWRAKMHSTDRAIRVKDLVDLVAVVRQYPLDDSVFWDRVADEFVLACEERLVDCEGWSTFEAMERDTRSTFAGDVGLQRLATMDTCWSVLRSVVEGLSERKVFPVRNPLDA